MKENTFGNDFSLATSLKFFYKWRKVLLLIFIVSFALSLVASLLITPRYKSSIVFFPTSSNRVSKAIITDRYDFMDYGSERDCEYAIQILSSQAMMDDVCKRFNLMEHYGISSDAEDKYFQFTEKYQGNVTVRRTEYLAVEVVVLDEAYIDFGGESAVPLIRKYDNLLVTRTFSKSRSMAGARLGFGVGNPHLIRDLITIKYSTNPYNVNSMTQAAGLGTMADEAYTLKNCQTIYKYLINHLLQNVAK